MLHQRNLRLYGPQVRVKSTHIGMIGVFVSNLNIGMMRSRDKRVSPGGREPVETKRHTEVYPCKLQGNAAVRHVTGVNAKAGPVVWGSLTAADR